MESFTPQFPDQTIATVGTQTISYDLSGGADSIIQRIDKDYALGEFWYFGRPQLNAVNVSIVTRNNPNNGYSCYVSGSENIYLPPEATLGYADRESSYYSLSENDRQLMNVITAAFANILLRDAARLYPKLLLGFKATPVLQASTLVSHGVSYPALTDAYLNITVAFDSKTFLPHIVRAYEDHHIFGNSTSDFILYNYTAVAGVQIPRRIKLMYNEDNLLVDALIGDIEANPKFSQGYFDGLPQSAISQTALQISPRPAAASAEYGDAEVFEFAYVISLYRSQDQPLLTDSQVQPAMVRWLRWQYQECYCYVPHTRAERLDPSDLQRRTRILHNYCQYGRRCHGHRLSAASEQACHPVDQGKLAQIPNASSGNTPSS